MSHSSFRFLAESGNAGATLTLACEGFQPPKDAKKFVDKTFTIETYDVGPGGRKISGKPIATFTATLVQGAGKIHPPYYFKDLQRTDSGPTELPGPEIGRKYTDPVSHIQYDLYYEPNWIPPHFYVTVTPVPGGTEPLRMVLIPDGGASRERYFHDIAFTVSVGGAKIFDSARNPIRIDCNALLAHNCREAAEMMMKDHQDLVDNRGVGLKYGSQCTSVTADQKRIYSLQSESCISYLLAVLKLGHEKTGATSEWKSIHKSVVHGEGISLAKGLQKHQWVTLFFCPDARHFRDLDWHYVRWRRRHHRDSLRAAAGKGGHKGYYKDKSVRVEDLILDYAPIDTYYKWKTPLNFPGDPDHGYYYDSHDKRWVEFPEGMPEILALNGTSIPVADRTPEKTDKYNKLQAIDFGIINVVDGYHTALFSRGLVYEAHWDKKPTDKELYATTTLKEWQDGFWGDGIVQVPATLWKP